MPMFRRAEWPRDHRDEVVAGALVGAVIIVLGYASGIGAPSGTAEAAAPPASPPAASAPASPAAPGNSGGTGAQAPGTGELPSYGGVGGIGGTGADNGYGTGGQGDHSGHTGGTGGTGDPGHPGHETSPTPAPGTTSPTPSPTDPDADTCEDGEVTLVQPLLTGLAEPVFGLLNGGDTEETPEPQPSPCVGLAPVSVTGLLGISASPLPEATP
ncbi:hypothetical protein OHB06_21615 [Streptomyces sp. NBC_01604]|uniref:hypothetical protein n=1 Tax=Streptomyces sp. NBC_01604 TaxID=2975894 RepID=UPI00386FE2D4